MKTSILIFSLFLYAVAAWGQEIESVPLWRQGGELRTPYELVLTPKSWVRLWDEWADSCHTDTLRVTPYGGEFLIHLSAYDEMVSEEQLRRRGYRYEFRWITNMSQPLAWEYVYVRDPNNLGGFMEFLRKKTK